ncbi:ubiquitin family protein, partial [Photorhabdus bodei]|nr:hypothetical protein [Photorhabdus bodei]
MSVMVHIPTILRIFTNDQKTVTSSGENVCELIDNLDIYFPRIKDRLASYYKKSAYFSIEDKSY